MLPLSVNFHFLKNCNSRCRFCFARFDDVVGRLSLDEALRVIEALRASGCSKFTLAGGEPTIDPEAGEMLSHARSLGFVTSVVTNGYRLSQLLDGHADDLDWIGLSLDSADERVQAALGRGRGDHVANVIRLARLCLVQGIQVKLNTVVTDLNWREDLRPLVRRVHPARWKVFQVLPISGQNEQSVHPLLISDAQFASFIGRNSKQLGSATRFVFEDNAAMTGSYLMVDPLGRFFSNTTGRHVYSDPILEVGVETAFSQITFSQERFESRGGRYSW
jgi:radical S-adenosyl methionine domain-containing protein 2